MDNELELQKQYKYEELIQMLKGIEDALQTSRDLIKQSKGLRTNEQADIVYIKNAISVAFEQLNMDCMDVFHLICRHLSFIECTDFELYTKIVKQYPYVPYIRNSMLDSLVNHIETYVKHK